MALYPLHAYERNPLGVIPLEAGQAVEGGQVGEVVNDGTGLPEVDLFGDSGTGTYQLSLVGLVDDSTTGLHYGVTGHGTPLRPGVTELTGTPAGPATHFGSNKCTLWTDSGLFATDVWDTSVAGRLLSDLSGAGAIPGETLYAATGAQLGNLSATAAGTDALGRFVRSFTGGLTGVSAFDSWFLPRVQPLPAGRVFMVIKFK